jgi:hypothetical protein
MINQRKRVSAKESPVNIYATAASVRESESVKEIERERVKEGLKTYQVMSLCFNSAASPSVFHNADFSSINQPYLYYPPLPSSFPLLCESMYGHLSPCLFFPSTSMSLAIFFAG